MAKIRLAHGVWTNGGALVLAGAGGVTGATATNIAAQVVGWAGMGFGIALLVWGVTIDGDHWWDRIWRRFRPPPAPSSPISVSNVMYVDCEEVTDPIGVAKVDNLYSVAVCLQVENKASDGRTIRGLTATIYQAGLHRTRLHIRKSTNDQVDLRHGELELIEVGRMLLAVEPGKTPALVRAGAGRRSERLEDINYAFNPAPQMRSMMISGDVPFGVASMQGPHESYLTVVLSATDEPAKDVLLRLNLWDANPYQWLQVATNEAGA